MNRFHINRQKCACWFLCLFFLLSTGMPVSARAGEAQEKAIRTAFFDGAYIQKNENGKKSGYGYEFQQAVASYTGWKYDYIKCDWTNCYKKLESGEIDLLGGISYTEERAKTMLFSDMPMGEEKYYLYADFNNTDLSFSDLNSLNGKKIGVLEHSIPEKLLNEWEEKHNLQLKHISIISAADILDKLADHEIDCFISNEDSQWGKSGITAVSLIGNSDIYYAVNKNRPDLKAELDNAMRKIEHDKPFYKEDLYKKYFSAESYEILSPEEQNWLDQHGVIRVGYHTGDSGVSVIDPDNGKIVGAINDYIKHATNCLGNQVLKFKLIGFDTQPEQYEALKTGKVDMIFHANQNPYQAEQNDLILSNTVFESSMAVMTASNHFDEHKENIVAVSEDSILSQWYIEDNYPQWKIYTCDSKDDVKKAVQSGKADCYVIKARQSLKESENKKIRSVFLTNSDFSCFAVKRENTTLLTILNKTLDSIQTSQMSGAAAAYENVKQKVTLSEFVKDNFVVVTTVFGSMLLLVLFVLLDSFRKTRKALVQAENANAAKSNFLFNMSHDIRTPMNAILGYEKLIRAGLTDPKLLHYQDRMEQASEILLSLINNVLDMARIESGRMELDETCHKVGNVISSVNQVFEVAAKEKGLEFEYHTEVCHSYIMCDITKVQEIFTNLISNAVKYTQPGGKISVVTRELPYDREGYILIETVVKDTGIGMSREFLPHLFDEFSREKNTTSGKVAGTGLGMPIVKRLVELMSGKIEVESTLGKGSRFAVTIPHRLADKKYYQKEMDFPTQDRKPENLNGIHILLAEDNELNAEIAIAILEGMGAIIDLAADGIECVDKLQQNPEGTYDLILMDIQMPNMDGYKATQVIRRLPEKEKAAIPIIAMTANAFEEDKRKALENGMNGHISKPIDVEKLEQTVARILKNKKE